MTRHVALNPDKSLQILLSRMSGKKRVFESSVVVAHLINNKVKVLSGWIGGVELSGRVYVASEQRCGIIQCCIQAATQEYIITNTLRKHAYSNIKKISPPKTENFQVKISDIFHISAQNIDCGYSLEPPRRGGSNEYPQSMF